MSCCKLVIYSQMHAVAGGRLWANPIQSQFHLVVFLITLGPSYLLGWPLCEPAGFASSITLLVKVETHAVENWPSWRTRDDDKITGSTRLASGIKERKLACVA